MRMSCELELPAHEAARSPPHSPVTSHDSDERDHTARFYCQVRKHISVSGVCSLRLITNLIQHKDEIIIHDGVQAMSDGDHS